MLSLVKKNMIRDLSYLRLLLSWSETILQQGGIFASGLAQHPTATVCSGTLSAGARTVHVMPGHGTGCAGAEL